MNLMNFQLFTESKNYQNLYHIIDFEKLRYIIENNKLSPYKAGGGYISFTRDKMMGGYLGSGPISFIKLEIDSQRLSTKYKIKPFSFRSYNGQQFDEREERVKGNIDDIFKYVNKVIIDKKQIERFKTSFRGDGAPSDWFTDVREIQEFRTIPSMMRFILDNIDNDLLYVQEGNVIKKDFNYLESISNYKLFKINFKYDIWYRGHFQSKRFKYAMDDIMVDSNGYKRKDFPIGGEIEEIPNGGLLRKDILELPLYPPKIIDGVECVPYIIKFREIQNNGGYMIDDMIPYENIENGLNSNFLL